MTGLRGKYRVGQEYCEGKDLTIHRESKGVHLRRTEKAPGVQVQWLRSTSNTVRIPKGPRRNLIEGLGSQR